MIPLISLERERALSISLSASLTLETLALSLERDREGKDASRSTTRLRSAVARLAFEDTHTSSIVKFEIKKITNV
jgi:hypothetical protein